MALFDIPRAAEPPKNPTAEVAAPTYKHSIVDSQVAPVDTILAFIGGSRWEVDYYSQMVGASEELKAFDPNQLGAYQNYHKINRLIIKLQGSLTYSDEADTGRMGITGTAIVTPLPNLIPNVGDAFIGDIGAGRAGQFTVTSIRKLTVQKATAWEIGFSMDRVVDANLEAKLNAKVSKESHYQRDYLILGQDALLGNDQFIAAQQLQQHLNQISTLYMNNHYSYDNRTVLIPGQAIPIYDPYVTRAILRIIDPSDCGMISDVTEYNCDDHRIPKYTDLYTVALDRKPAYLNLVFSTYTKLAANRLNPSVYQNSVRYSGIVSVIVPQVKEGGVDNYQLLNNMASSASANLYFTGRYFYTLMDNNATAPDPVCSCDPYASVDSAINADPAPIVTYGTPGVLGMDIPAIGNQSYVLSKAFYKQDWESCTRFELLVRDMINNRPVNPEDLYPFCESYVNWGKVEQYYLGPLLLLIIRYALRSA